MQFNARVHYTVLTQHPTQANNHKSQSGHYIRVGYNQGIMPQTPNNAPSTSNKRVSWQTIDCFWLRRISTRLNKSGSRTIAYSTTTQPPQQQTRVDDDCFKHQLVRKIMLLRKEVIHPHLPVRVPCYDFVPIADPTFDGSLTSLGHRLRVLPTFMT